MSRSTYIQLLKLVDPEIVSLNETLWKKLSEFDLDTPAFLSIAGFVVSDLVGAQLLKPDEMFKAISSFSVDFNNKQITVQPRRLSFDAIDPTLIEYLQDRHDFLMSRVKLNKSIESLKVLVFARISQIHSLKNPECFIVDADNFLWVNIPGITEKAIEVKGEG